MDFGVTNGGEKVTKVVIRDAYMTVHIITMGASIQSLFVNPPEDEEAMVPLDIVLGYDSAQKYKENVAYFGCSVGRVAGRIGGGRFMLDSDEHFLTRNDGKNCLHGGYEGVSRRNWTVEAASDHSVRLSVKVPDCHEGFPGVFRATVTYTLRHQGELVVSYEATCTKLCPVSMTNHSYFNLDGHNYGNIYDQTVLFKGVTKSLVLDQHLVPTGDYISCEESLRRPALMSDYRLNGIGKVPHGYDHYMIFDGYLGQRFVRVQSTNLVGRFQKYLLTLEMTTDQPGFQFYTANFLSNECGKGGFCYRRHSGFCLEPQKFPNTMHHKYFPSNMLKPGNIYYHETVFKIFYEKAPRWRPL